MSYRLFDSLILETVDALSPWVDSELSFSAWLIKQFVLRGDCSGGVIDTLDRIIDGTVQPLRNDDDLAGAFHALALALTEHHQFDLCNRWFSMVAMGFYVQMRTKERRAFRQSSYLPALLSHFHQNFVQHSVDLYEMPSIDDFASEFSTWDWYDDENSADIKFLLYWYAPVSQHIQHHDAVKYETACLRFQIEEMRGELMFFPKRAIISEWLILPAETLSEEQRFVLLGANDTYRDFRRVLKRALSRANTLLKLTSNQLEILSLVDALKRLSSVPTHLIIKDDVDALLASSWFNKHIDAH